ncbi:MAG: peptide-methionine (S)-S-oxide reductase MsrA [Verrucomicrobiota bacterium]
MKITLSAFSLLLSTLFLLGCTAESADPNPFDEAEKMKAPKFAPLPVPDESNIPETAEVATVGGGCFWCTEEVFHQVDGVYSVVSGYMGGTPKDANYKAVSGGRTDHAEVIQIHYDPTKISFEGILDVFWNSHDPTTLNRQGPDRGPQYRSAIFYHSPEQKMLAEASKQKADASGKFTNPIVTEITEAPEFYVAEDYHQNYARLNPGNPYLHQQLFPKLMKLGMTIPMGTSAKEVKGSGTRPK